MRAFFFFRFFFPSGLNNGVGSLVFCLSLDARDGLLGVASNGVTIVNNNVFGRLLVLCDDTFS